MWLEISYLVICLYLVWTNRKLRLEQKFIRDTIKGRWKLMDDNASQINETFKKINTEIAKLSDKTLTLEKDVDKSDLSDNLKRLERKIIQNTRNIQNVFKFNNDKPIHNSLHQRSEKTDRGHESGDRKNQRTSDRRAGKDVVGKSTNGKI